MKKGWCVPVMCLWFVACSSDKTVTGDAEILVTEDTKLTDTVTEQEPVDNDTVASDSLLSDEETMTDEDLFPDETPMTGIPGIKIGADIRVGSESISYMNPEFTSDGRYMVWFEPDSDGLQSDGRLYGTVWHCAIDPDTGDLVPPDGRGFAAFPATIWTRANPGRDAVGPYYVGQYATRDADERNDHFVIVRPTGPTTGEVTVLEESVAQSRRRSIFPTSLADRELNEQYIWWLENDTGYTPSKAESVQLKYIAIADPAVEYVITTQQAPGQKWCPMDMTYVRLVVGTPFLTFGIPVGTDIEVATFDLADPQSGIYQVTEDGLFKLDPFSFTYENRWYFIAGINGTEESILYASDGPREPFSPLQTIRVDPNTSEIPEDFRCQPMSHETFSLAGRMFSAFQISNCESSGNFFTRQGEIWLTEIFSEPHRVVRLSIDGPEAKNEPEIAVGATKAWVFYTMYPAGQSPVAVQYQLRRVSIEKEE